MDHGEPEAGAPGLGRPRRGLLHGGEDAERLAEATAAQQHRPVQVLGLDALGHRVRLGHALHQRGADQLVAPDADQLGAGVGAHHQQPLDRGVAEQRGQVAVERAGRSAALHVAEDRHLGLAAQLLLQRPLHVVHGDRVAVPVVGALGDDHQVAPATVLPAGPQHRTHQLGPVVGDRRALRDEHPVRPGGQRRHEREVAAVPAHHLDHERALVAGGGAVQGVQRLDDAVQRGVGADRHVGAEHVVVDRPDHADQPQVLVRRGPSGCSSPASTSSLSSSGHSSRNRFAPVRLPSPPITTSPSMPRSTRLRAARRRPSRVRNSADRAVPISVPPLLQDPADVGGLEPPDQLARPRPGPGSPRRRRRRRCRGAARSAPPHAPRGSSRLRHHHW